MFYCHCSSTLEYAVGKVHDNQMRFKLNGTHQVIAYVDNVNLLRDGVNILNKRTETLAGASKEVGLEVNT
jgi:hypothetical protein